MKKISAFAQKTLVVKPGMNANKLRYGGLPSFHYGGPSAVIQMKVDGCH